MISCSSLNPSSATQSLSKMIHPPLTGPKFGEMLAQEGLSKESKNAIDSATTSIAKSLKPDVMQLIREKSDVETAEKRLKDSELKFDQKLVKTFQELADKYPEKLNFKANSLNEGKQIAEYARQSIKKALGTLFAKDPRAIALLGLQPQ
jgi:thymidylate kinase